MYTLAQLKPNQPNHDEWMSLALNPILLSDSHSKVDIIIPVYGAPDDTLRCIFSVLNTKNDIPFNLVVIEDYGPIPELRSQLKQLSRQFHFEYYENPENLGFVLTCNRGFDLHQDRDVILLNSDTEVFDGWLDRMIDCAIRNPKAGTITAVSNNATICSYPFFCEDYSYGYEITDAQLSILFAKYNAKQSVVAPTGVGFCMYIRRNCLKQIGGFNYKLFGKGYGEENDLCVRAKNAGWENLIAVDTFVRHYGSSSFSNNVRLERVNHAINVLKKVHPNYLPSVREFIAMNPMKPFLNRIDCERLNQYIHNKKVILYITHDLGGGTEKHHLEMVDRLVREGYAVLSLKPHDKYGAILYLEGIYPVPNIKIPTNTIELMNCIKNIWSVSVVHIHHLKGFGQELVDSLINVLIEYHIPYYFTVHDYYSICPRINLIGVDNVFCGEPIENFCNQCIKGMKEAEHVGCNISKWRQRYQIIMENAQKVFVPDADVQWRLQRYFAHLDFIVRPHFDIWEILPEMTNISKNHPLPLEEKELSSTRIGIIGAIGHHKGYYQVLEVAELCQKLSLNIQFVIIGYTQDDVRLSTLNNVEILGKYEDKELIGKILSAQVNAIWFPAIWPETYSYTLSAALLVGLPIIAFDFGAIARRVRETHQNSILIPIEKMLQPMQMVQYFLYDFAKMNNHVIYTNHEYGSLAKDYYQFTD